MLKITLSKLKLIPSGPQLPSSKIQQNFHSAMETMDHQESTARPQLVPELTDHSMDQQELPAPRKNQHLSHITTPTQPPEDHSEPLVILPSKTQHHQSHLKLSSNSVPSQLLPQLPPPQPPLLPCHHQRRSQSLTQRLPRPTLLSTVNNELKINESEKIRVYFTFH